MEDTLIWLQEMEDNNESWVYISSVIAMLKKEKEEAINYKRCSTELKVEENDDYDWVQDVIDRETMSKRCELQKEYFKEYGNYKGEGKYNNHYVHWLENKVLALTLTSVSSMFYAEQMEKAYNDGVEAEQQRCGEFDIENYC